MDSLFFYASKLIWSLISPDHFLLILITVASVSWLVRRPCDLRICGSVKVLALGLILIWCIALYPVGNWLLYPLESRYQRPDFPAAEDVAGVIVLGGPERMIASDYWDGLEINAAGERLLAMVQLLKHYPDIPFIYTGGSGSALNQELKGADLVQRYLQEMKMDDQVIFERRSRNTYENATYTAQLIADLEKAGEQGSAPWLLVTSAFHMPRSVGLFNQQGIALLPYPVDHWSLPTSSQGIHFNLADNLVQLKMGMREWIGLFAYWFTGKTASLLPVVPFIAPLVAPSVKAPPVKVLPVIVQTATSTIDA